MISNSKLVIILIKKFNELNITYLITRNNGCVLRIPLVCTALEAL